MFKEKRHFQLINGVILYRKTTVFLNLALFKWHLLETFQLKIFFSLEKSMYLCETSQLYFDTERLLGPAYAGGPRIDGDICDFNLNEAKLSLSVHSEKTNHLGL